MFSLNIDAGPSGLVMAMLSSIILLVAGAVLTAIYRLTLHPLAKYPGPFLSKVTDLHLAYHAWKGDRHIENLRCHDKYGDIVRVGPNTLSFNSSDALRTIYGSRANCWKGRFYTVFPSKKGFYSTHTSINRDEHAQKRRVLSHAFSDKALKSMEDHILVHVRDLCFHLSSSLVPQNMALWYDNLTFDIMGDLCFGKSLGMLKKPDNRFVSELICNAARRHNTCGSYPIIHELHLDKVIFPGLSSGTKRFVEYGRSQATERMAKQSDGETERKDFFYYLLNSKDSETGTKFTMPELWAEVNLLIVAGSDTTSTSLSATLFYLLNNPSCLRQLTEEIRSTFDGMDIENIRPGTLLSSCIYLRACIDEAMRLSPPVPGHLPREVHLGGMTIDGYSIPAGTIVGVAAYTVHHNPNYYPEPFSYIPDRWLPSREHLSPDLAKVTVETVQSAFCPFSIGPRGCIGKPLAYIELMATLARIVYLFDLKLASPLGGGSSEAEQGRRRTGEYQLEDTFTSRKDGPMVEFKLRKT